MIHKAKLYMYGFIKALQHVIAFHWKFILTFFIMNFLTIGWSLFSTDRPVEAVLYGFTLLLALIFFTALIGFIPFRKLQDIIKIFVIAICSIPFLLETFTMYNYHALIGAGIINSILETNFKESIEFIQMYVGFKEFTIVFFVSAVMAYIVIKKPYRNIRVPERILSTISTLIIIICTISAVYMDIAYAEILYGDPLPIQRVYASAKVAVDNMNAYKELVSKVNDDVRLTGNDSKIKNVVFILGESTNRNHMHLYGYKLKNTPNLDRMESNGDIAVFRDVVSPHSTTIAVLSELFTFCHHESDMPWYNYTNLIDVMNAAGYKTHWMSNQESSGIWGNVAQVYASHSTVHRFTRIRDSHEDNGVLDEELFPLIDDALASDDRDGKNFYVVHLMGGHGLYYNRFPYSFFKFNADDIDMDLPEEKRTVMAEYDDALYYNDYIVSSIIDKFRDSETLVIYLPDHGEAVYDDGGFNGHIEENPSRHMIEVPMVIWASDSFKDKYPDNWKRIMVAVNRPYMTDDMIHTVLDLTDIRTEDYDPTRSIVNDMFNSQRPRIFNGMNYDTEIR